GLDNIMSIKAIRPLYRDDRGEETKGKQFGTKITNVLTVKAKAGYAVGAITVNAGLWVDGMTVTFMREKEGRLDPTDSYQTDYIGRQGGTRTILGGDGTLAIGIVGKTNTNDCTGIGMVFKK